MKKKKNKKKKQGKKIEIKEERFMTNLFQQERTNEFRGLRQTTIEFSR